MVAEVELLIRKRSLSDDLDRWSFARTFELARCLPFSGGVSTISPDDIASGEEGPEVMSDIVDRAPGSSKGAAVTRNPSRSILRGWILSSLAPFTSLMVSVTLSISPFGKSVFPNSLNP